jgi:hypothetical protein
MAPGPQQGWRKMTTPPARYRIPEPDPAHLLAPRPISQRGGCGGHRQRDQHPTDSRVDRPCFLTMSEYHSRSSRSHLMVISRALTSSCPRQPGDSHAQPPSHRRTRARCRVKVGEKVTDGQLPIHRDQDHCGVRRPVHRRAGQGQLCSVSLKSKCRQGSDHLLG